MNLKQIQHDVSALVQCSTADTAEVTGLAASRCAECDAVYFPQRVCCERCASGSLRQLILPACGEVWSWTTQAYPPPSPPFLFSQERADFTPYHVGYVNLGETLVLARLDYPRRQTPKIGDIVTLNWSVVLAPEGKLKIPVFAFGMGASR